MKRFCCKNCDKLLGYTNGRAFYYSADGKVYFQIQANKTPENKKGELKITCDCGRFRIWTPLKIIDVAAKVA